MDSTVNPAAPPTNQPPLAIMHLLGWTLGCSIMLAGFRWMTVDASGPAEVAWQTRLSQFGFSLVYGTTLAGLGLVLWRKFYGGHPFPTQPGHWLLVLGGVGCLVDAGTSAPWTLFMRWAEKHEFVVSISAQYLHRSIAWGIAGVIGLLILFRLRSSRRWRAFAAVAVLAIVANALAWVWMAGYYQWCIYAAQRVALWAFFVPFGSEAIGSLTLLVSLAILVWLDSRSPEKRDWLHWTGVCTALCLAMLHVAMSVWSLTYWI